MADDDLSFAVSDYLADPSAPVSPRLRDSLYQGVQAKPDYEAEMRQASRVTGVDFLSLRANEEHAKAALSVSRLDPDGIIQGAPRTATWLTQPQNAAIAHDDVPVLQGIEQTLKALGGDAAASLLGGAANLIGAGQSVLAQQAPGVKVEGTLGAISSPEMERYRAQYNLAADKASSPLFGPGSGFYTGLDHARKALNAEAKDATPEASNKWGDFLNQGVINFLQNLPTMGAAILTRNPAAAIAGAGAIAGGQAFGEAVDQGLGTTEAAQHGNKQGLVEMLGEMLPAHKIVKDLNEHAGFLKTLLHQGVTETLTEVPTTIVQDFNDWADMHPDKPFTDFVAQLPDDIAATVVAVAVGAAGNTALGHGMQAVANRGQRDVQKSDQAAQTGQLLDGLMKSAEASALRQRDPQTFHDYVAAVSQDTPVQSVYVNAQDLADVLSQGDPAKLEEGIKTLEAMPSVMPQLEDAMKSGGLVEIPVSELLAWTPETSLGQSLIEHLKVDPEAFSMKEAEVFLQEQGDKLQADVAKAIQDKGLADEFTQDAEGVRQGIKGQLDQANRFTPDVNDQYAGFVSSFIATQAANHNVLPSQMLGRLGGLTIQAQGVAPGSLTHDEASPKAIKVMGDEIAPIEADLPTQRLATKAWYDANLKGTSVDSRALGRPVQFRGSRKTFSASANPDKLRVFSALRDIIANGELVETQTPKDKAKNVKAYHYIRHEVDLGGKRMSVLVNIREDDKGNLYYNHTVGDETLGKPNSEDRNKAGTGTAPQVTPGSEGLSQDMVPSTDDVNMRLEPAAELHQSDAHFNYDPGLGFQSKLFNVVLEKGQAKASADQWLAMVGNSGVKKEELEWIGLAEGLKLMSAEGPVTKEQVLAYIAQNGVRLTEVGQSDAVEPSDEAILARMDDLMDEDRPDFDGDEDAEERWNNDNWGTYYDQAERDLEEEGYGRTQYSEYQAIEGGKNYRELLLILPRAGNAKLTRDFTSGMGHWNHDNVLAHTRLADFTTVDGKRALGVLEIQSDWHQKGRDRGYAVQASQEEREAATAAYDAALMVQHERGEALLDVFEPLFHEQIHALREYRDRARNAEEHHAGRVRELTEKLDDLPRRNGGVAQGEELRAQYNNAAQERDQAYRLAERLSGHINALQTAGSQIFGRDGAISRGEERVWSTVSRLAKRAELWVRDGGYPDDYGEVVARADLLEHANLKVDEADQRRAQTQGQTGIPDAPFKSTWPALVMKRLIREAVEGGYDTVVWATGEQQADLYDMRHFLGDITATRLEDGRVNLHIANGRRDAREALQQMGEAGDFNAGHGGDAYMTREQMVNALGGDLGGKLFDDATANGSTTYDGSNVQIGGEGHKAFYNRNLVNITNDIIKKMGAKVGVVNVVGQADRGMVSGEVVLRSRGVPEAQIGDTWRSMTQAERDAAFDAYRNAPTQGSPQWGFPVTEAMRALDKQTLFQATGEARGTFNPQTNTIVLLKNADLSTFLHETGHFFLESLAKLAAAEDAPQIVKDDWQKAAQFIGFGGSDPAAWLSIPVEGRREGHETWARGFEAYLREGRAPSAQLKGPFQRFKSWLVHVYQQLQQLNVTLTDEVRGVMDRLLATEQEIAQAEAARHFAPVLETKPEGMSDLEWESYQRLGAEATADAQDQLAARSIRDMRWLSNQKSRMLRQLTKEAKEKRQATRAEVQAEVEREPLYAAMQFLKRGLLNGEAAEGPHKLSISALEAIYKAAGVPTEIQDWRRLGYGKYGMLAEEGLDPDHVAELFGYSSGHELVEALLNAEPMRDKIEGMTDQRMLERYGDLTDPQAIERAADEAIHNDARLRFVATEASALAKAAGTTRIMAEAARDFARSLVGGQKVRDLRPGKYSGAETRAAIAASQAAAKGDLVTAATQKRNQLINGYAAKAAMQAQQEVEAILRYFARLDGAGARKAMDPTYRDQIDQLLERFDLRKGESLRAIDKRASLKKWMEQMEARGLEPIIDEQLANEAYRTHYKNLTVDELRGLRDAVKNIAHLGRLKNRLLVAAQGRAYQAVVDEAGQVLEANAYKTIPDDVEHNTLGAKLNAWVGSYLAQHRKLASLIRQMSGMENFDNGGILWRAFIQPMNKANDFEAARREAATGALMRIYKPMLQAGGLRTKMFIPALGKSLSLEGRLAVALNWGNELNRARIMDGDKWTADQAQAVLQTLTADQLKFVNDLHEYLDSFWPEIAAKERRISGVEPEKVEPEPYQVRSADGQLVDMRGGYYPIKYDTERSFRSEADAKSEELVSMQRGLYTRSTTKRGHTIARVDKVERPVRKDLNVAFQHVNQVIHDLAFHEYMIDANRLLKSLENTIKAHYGAPVVRTMQNALQAIAVGDLPAENALDRVVSYLRTGTSIVGLGFNLMTAIQQPLGLTQSVVRIGPRWVGQGALKAFKNAASLQNSVKAIGDKSEFMRLRARTMMREISEVQNQVQSGMVPDALEKLLGPAAFPAKQGANAMHAGLFALITKVQLVADVPTWLGAYDKALAGGNDEATAVDLADQAVRDSQGGGQIGDLAQYQRGSTWFKLWTQFYSFFSVGYNQLAESVAETRRVGASRLPLFAADFLLVAIMPYLLGELLKKALRGDDWDWDQLGPQLAEGQLSYLLGYFVFAREMGPIITSHGQQSGGQIRFFGDLAKFAKEAGQGQADDGLRKSAVTVGGDLLHFPAAQINRTIDGFEAMAKGETENPMALLFGPPRKAQ